MSMIHWRDIKNFEGLYQVSNTGLVKSVYKKIKFNVYAETILRPSTDQRGYLQVVMYRNGKPTARRVHRLVAESFIDNPNKKRTVNHINEIKTDNRVENLEWATDLEQMNHSMSKRVAQIKNGRIIKVWDSACAAARGGYHQGHISSCCNGKLKTHAGFQWRFA